MVVEIKQLSLKGRFGPAQTEEAVSGTSAEALRTALDALRHDLLREMDEKLKKAARRAQER